MTTTTVTWGADLTPAQSDLITTKAAEMAAQGKTDNNPVITNQPPDLIVVRTWTTLADAEEWVAFVEQFTPISATITS